MRKHTRGRVAATLATLALSATVPVALAHDDDDHGHGATGTLPAPHDGVTRSTFASLWQVRGGGASGVVGLRQTNGAVVVTLLVAGLEPRSRHAAHVHGPLATCRTTTKRHAIELGNLVANARGVARLTRRVAVDEQIAGMPGYFVMVHANPGAPMSHGTAMPENPPIACGNLPA